MNKQNEHLVIREVVRVLKRGGVIAYPTETTYGLGCDPRNAKAVKKIFAIKRRAADKKGFLVVASRTQVNKIAFVVGATLEVVSRYWPGPLTLLLPTRRGHRLASQVMAKDGSIAVRVSSSPFVQALTKAYGFPIVSTSANPSGQPDARSGRAVVRYFKDAKDQPDLVIDAGSLPRRKPSTITRIHEDGHVEIVRQGGLRVMLSVIPAKAGIQYH